MAFHIDTHAAVHYCDGSCPTHNSVLDWLYIGAAIACGKILDEDNCNINVISIGAPHITTSSPRTGAKVGERILIELLDDVNEDVLVHIDSVLQFLIKSYGKPTLLHCMHGKSRSAALLAASVMILTRCSANQAIRFVATCRPCIGMNWGFYAQLKILEAVLANDTRKLPPPLGFSVGSPSPLHGATCSRLSASGMVSSASAVYRLWASSATRHKYGRPVVAFNEIAFSTETGTPMQRIDSTLRIEELHTLSPSNSATKIRGMFVYPSDEATVPLDEDSFQHMRLEYGQALKVLHDALSGASMPRNPTVQTLLDPPHWQVFADVPDDTAAVAAAATATTSDVPAASSSPLETHWLCCGKCNNVLATNHNVVLLHSGAPSYGSCGAIFVEPMMWMVPAEYLDRAALERAAEVALSRYQARKATAVVVPTPAEGAEHVAPRPIKQRKYYALTLDAMRPAINPMCTILEGLKSKEGKLICPTPGCGAKVGAYAWNGITCPCADFVAPAFYLSAGKIVVRAK